MEEEEDRLDQLLFALSDVNGQEPATQSSARSLSPLAEVNTTAPVDIGEPESSTRNRSHQEQPHQNGNESEDSVFEDMGSHQPDAPAPSTPQRRAVKRKLPESLLFDHTRQSRLSTGNTRYIGIENASTVERI
jgi:hypothetical protein